MIQGLTLRSKGSRAFQIKLDAATLLIRHCRQVLLQPRRGFSADVFACLIVIEGKRRYYFIDSWLGRSFVSTRMLFVPSHISEKVHTLAADIVLQACYFSVMNNCRDFGFANPRIFWAKKQSLIAGISYDLVLEFGLELVRDGFAPKDWLESLRMHRWCIVHPLILTQQRECHRNGAVRLLENQSQRDGAL